LIGIALQQIDIHIENPMENPPLAEDKIPIFLGKALDSPPTDLQMIFRTWPRCFMEQNFPARRALIGMMVSGNHPQFWPNFFYR
jgi:hypothetical protein